LLSDFELDWPRAVKWFFSGVSTTSSFSLDASFADCALEWSPYTRFLALSIAIPVIIIIPAIVIRVIVDCHRSQQAAIAESDPDFVPIPLTMCSVSPLSLYTTVSLLLLFLLYPTVTTASLHLFRCTDAVDGVRYLSSDVRFRCGTPFHKGFTYASWAVLILFTVGFPLVCAGILYRFQDRLHTEKARRRIWFLFSGYALHAYYYESVIMARKALLVAVSVLLGGNQYGHQIFAGILVQLAALVTHLQIQPFKDPTQGQVEQWSIIASLAVLLLGQLLTLGGVSDLWRQLTAIVIALLVAVVVVACISLLIFDGVMAARSAELAEKVRNALLMLESERGDAKKITSVRRRTRRREDDPWSAAPLHLQGENEGMQVLPVLDL